MLITIFQVTSMGKTMKEVLNVPIPKEENNYPEGRPRVPAQTFLSATVDTDMKVMSIVSRFDVGEVSAVLENLLTGDYSAFSFDSAKACMLPFSGESGTWRIALSLSDSTDYVGEFTI